MSVVSKNEKNQPAPKLLPYGVADIKFLCQWYEKNKLFEKFAALTYKTYVSTRKSKKIIAVT